jgi:hypothetical protein
MGQTDRERARADITFVALPMRMLGAFRRAGDRVTSAFDTLKEKKDDAQAQAMAMASALFFLHLVTDPTSYKEPAEGDEYTDPRFDWIGLADFELVMELVNEAIKANKLTEKERGN